MLNFCQTIIKKRRWQALSPVITLCLLLLSSQNTQAQWYQKTASIMGTNIEMDIWAKDQSQAEQAIATTLMAMNQTNQMMSRYKPNSELSQLNQMAFTKPMVVSDALWDVIGKSLEMSRLTQGAFDITTGVVLKTYDFKKRRLPSTRQLLDAVKKVNYRQLVLNPEAKTVQFLQQGMSIDLGGIAKGYAVDQAINALNTLGIKHARVTAGGDTRLLGDYNGRDWSVGIKHPRAKNKMAMALPLRDVAISTSGDYERYFIQRGQRYHHIINPQSGRSISGVVSATVLAPDSMTADALSTSVFVLGIKKGLALVDTLSDIDAIMIDSKGKVHYSSGLQPPSQ